MHHTTNNQDQRHKQRQQTYKRNEQFCFRELADKELWWEEEQEEGEDDKNNKT